MLFPSIESHSEIGAKHVEREDFDPTPSNNFMIKSIGPTVCICLQKSVVEQ